MKKFLTFLLSFLMIFNVFIISGCGENQERTGEFLFINDNLIWSQNDKYGVINKDGNTEIPYVYDKILRIGQTNNFFAERDRTLLIINKNGIVKEIGPYEIWAEIERHTDEFQYKGISIYTYYERNSGLYGLINAKGDILSRPLYDSIQLRITSDNPNYIRVKKDDKYGIIDTNGQQVIDCEYSQIQIIEDIFLVAKESSDSYQTYFAIMDKNGDILSPYKYTNYQTYFCNKDVIYTASYTSGSYYLTGINTHTGEETFRKGINDSYKNGLFMGKYGFIMLSDKNNLTWYNSDGKVKKEIDSVTNFTTFAKTYSDGLIYITRLGMIEVYDLNCNLKYKVDLDDYDEVIKTQWSASGDIILTANKLTILDDKQTDIALKLGNFVYSDYQYEYGIESVDINNKVVITYKKERGPYTYYDSKTYGLVSFDGKVIFDNTYQLCSFHNLNEYIDKYDFVELLDTEGVRYLYRVSDKKIIQSGYKNYNIYDDGYISFTTDSERYFTDWEGNRTLSFLTRTITD